MPTGTGKTVSLLSVFVSYLIAHPDCYVKVDNNFLFTSCLNIKFI